MDAYNCWLQYEQIEDEDLVAAYHSWCENLVILENSPVIKSAERELVDGIASMIGRRPAVSSQSDQKAAIILGTVEKIDAVGNDLFQKMNEGAYAIKASGDQLFLVGKTDKGVLYAAFHLLRFMQQGKTFDDIEIVENPGNPIRMIDQWDNMDGSIERGYAGKSIFYQNGQVTSDLERIRDYARLLSSVGINAIAINNVNVHRMETNLITDEFLPAVAKIAEVFRSYGIQMFLSINYASPIQLGALPTADPLDPEVSAWWRNKAEEIYRYIPDLGGFLVKADSENRPGPFTYDRSHAEGANMLAKALKPFNGLVIWRCFVYNCHQDWRDRKTDRARAAYDHFKPLDGEFSENVILQIKNGPMDFQVREPVSPLFGGMERTNQMLELQITQEYTGQQRHLCYLVPQWKEILDFDTHAKGEGSTVKAIADGSLFGSSHCGMAAVSNIGDDLNWTGHILAQANLFGYGRLTWNPDLSSEVVTEDWVRLTFGNDPDLVEEISEILLSSWRIYENYTSPLGVGWMVNPGHHYGPNVDGYEYSAWGTYHFADWQGVGVNRTMKDGTGYTGQYFPENREVYESLEHCPDDVILFFHHVPYTHELKSGETVIQHIYDSHFEGVEQAQGLKDRWERLKGKIDGERFDGILSRLEKQAEHAKEWRDIINTYFYRKSGIQDEKNRMIY